MHLMHLIAMGLWHPDPKCVDLKISLVPIGRATLEGHSTCSEQGQQQRPFLHMGHCAIPGSPSPLMFVCRTFEIGKMALEEEEDCVPQGLAGHNWEPLHVYGPLLCVLPVPPCVSTLGEGFPMAQWSRRDRL